MIKKQIIDAKSFAKNDDIIIYLDPADASKKHDLEEETKCTLTMSEYSFGGGHESCHSSKKHTHRQFNGFKNC